MKLVIAIVSKEDSRGASSALIREGFSVTQLPTRGGFLMAGNMTLLMGVADEKVDQCIEVLRRECQCHTEVVPEVMGYTDVGAMTQPKVVTVGGATVFVTDIERFEKL